MSPRTLPTIREVETWDREHRRECQEARCTLAHRMLVFADWYIVIVHGFEARAATAERKRVLDGLEAVVRGLPVYGDTFGTTCELAEVLSAIEAARGKV